MYGQEKQDNPLMYITVGLYIGSLIIFVVLLYTTNWFFNTMEYLEDFKGYFYLSALIFAAIGYILYKLVYNDLNESQLQKPAIIITLLIVFGLCIVAFSFCNMVMWYKAPAGMFMDTY